MKKMIKKHTYIFTFSILLVSIILTYFVIGIIKGKAADSEDRIHFLSAGESMIIESNGHYGLIDAMNSKELDSVANGETVLNYAKKIGCTYFDFVIITHSHYDHNSGIPELKELFNDKTILFYKDDLIVADDYEENLHLNSQTGVTIPYNNHGYQELAIQTLDDKNAIKCEVTHAKELNDSKCNLSSLHNGYITSVNYDANDAFKNNHYDSNVRNNIYFNFGDFKINLYALYNMSYHKENLNSIVTTVTHKTGGAKAALPGDIETAINDQSYGLNLSNFIAYPTGTCYECTHIGIENQVSDVIGKVDLLKSSHHGTNTANSYYTLDNYQPSYYVTMGDLANDPSKGPYPGDRSNSAAIIYLKRKFDTKSYYSKQTSGALVAQFSDNSKDIQILSYNSNGEDTQSSIRRLGDYYLDGWQDINTLTLDNQYVWVENGQPVFNDWRLIDSKWYHFGNYGLLDLGFFTDTDGSVYYLSENTSDSLGSMLTGWQEINEYEYFFRIEKDNISEGPKGSMVKGLHKVGSDTYYFIENSNEGPVGSILKNGSKKIGKTTYLFDSAGKLASTYDDVSVTIPTSSKCLNIKYNGTEQTFANNETGYTLSNNKGKLPGTYTVTATISNGYIWSDGTYTNKTFDCSISKGKHSLPIVSGYSGTYDGLSHGITVSDIRERTPLYSTDGVNYSKIVPTRTNAGVTTVYVKYEADSNYDEGDPSSASINITKANPTINKNGILDIINVGFENNVLSLKSNISGIYTITYDSKYLDLDSSVLSASADETIYLSVTGLKKGITNIGISFAPSDSTNYFSYSTTYDLTINNNVATIPNTNTYCKTNLVYNGESQVLTNNHGVGYTFTNNSGINAGVYNVNAVLSNGYEWSDSTTTDKTINCSIGKDAINNFSVTSYTGVYDGSEHFVSVSSVAGGTIKYSLDNSSWTTTPYGLTDVGTKTIYVFAEGDSNHLNSDVKTSSINITKATPNITTNVINDSVMVDNSTEIVSLTSNVAGKYIFTPSDNILSSYQREISASKNEKVSFAASGTSVGTTSLNVSFVPDSSNYTTINKTFTIEVKENTAKIINVPTASSSCISDLVYDGNNKKLTVDDTNAYEFINNNQTNAGSYVVTVRLKDSYKWNDLSTSDKTITCSIAKADLSVPTINGYLGDYDGNKHYVSVQNITGATTMYSLDGDNWVATPISRTDAGTTKVYIKFMGDNNHNDSTVYSTNIVINKSNSVISSTNLKDTIEQNKVASIGPISANLNGVFTITTSNGDNLVSSITTKTVSKDESFAFDILGKSVGNESYTVTFTPTSTNYNSSSIVTNVTIKEPEKIKVSIPTSDLYCKKDLKYTGNPITITNDPLSGYTFKNNVQTNADIYTVVASLNDGYVWNDNTTSDKSFNCIIMNEDGYINFDTNNVRLKNNYIITKNGAPITYNTVKNYINTNGTLNYTKSDEDNVATCDTIRVNFDSNAFSYTMVVPGDVNKTGTIDASDVTLIFDYLKNRSALLNCQNIASDVTGDNEIHINDVAKVYQYINGKIERLDS